MLRKDQMPACPSGDRILVEPEMPETESIGGLIIPQTSQMQAMFGRIMHAGLAARDQMYDNGHEIGDRIWHGQFAGVWAEFDRLTKEGSDDCAHGDWSRVEPFGVFKTEHFECSACGAHRTKSPMLAMKVEDIIANDTLEDRMRRGLMYIARAKDADGRTQHVFRYKEIKNAAA